MDGDWTQVGERGPRQRTKGTQGGWSGQTDLTRRGRDGSTEEESVVPDLGDTEKVRRREPHGVGAPTPHGVGTLGDRS